MQAAEREMSVTDDVPDLSEDQEVETVILGHICVDGGDGHQGRYDPREARHRRVI